MNTCAQCGMLCLSNEYHPYAACMMYELCRNGNTVRRNLASIVVTAKTDAIVIYDCGKEKVAFFTTTNKAEEKTL